MRKRTAILLLACGMIACMLASGAQAATSALNQAVARNITASLRYKLQIADQRPELSPLVNSTHVLLDALEDALLKNDSEAMRAAVEQYADEVQFFQNAAAIDTGCALSLASGLIIQISAMIQTAMGGGMPVCMFISIGNNVAEIVSSIINYSICAIDNSTNPDTVKRKQLVQTQQVVKIYEFIASVVKVVLCSQPLQVADIFSVILLFISLFITG